MEKDYSFDIWLSYSWSKSFDQDFKKSIISSIWLLSFVEKCLITRITDLFRVPRTIAPGHCYQTCANKGRMGTICPANPEAWPTRKIFATKLAPIGVITPSAAIVNN